MRIFSSGGGQQSTACLVLAATGRLDFSEFVFVHMGEDTENPQTLRYTDEIAIPYATAHGIRFHSIRRQWRKGGDETLYQVLMREDSRSINIPIRMANGAPGRRNCTADFKIRVIAKWLRERGATEEAPATIGMGISLDEFHRMKKHSPFPFYRYEYPLVDLRLDRHACQQIIIDAGLPIPPKSSCWFCPYHTQGWWPKLKEDQPELFEKAAQLENHLNRRRARLGKDPIFIHNKLKPLEEATAESQAASPAAAGQQALFTEDLTCDSGHCFT